LGFRTIEIREPTAMRVAAAIEAKLTEALRPTRLAIVDDSHKHKGHVGARPEGETHFRVEVVSDAFSGRSRVERQRLIYGLLADELATHVHALEIKSLTPDEDAST